MQNEIPAGTKVKVAVLGKGVMSIRDAEVLAVSDGVVHVQMDGEAVSIDPSQIVPTDAPVATPVPPELESAVGEMKDRIAAALEELLRPAVDRITVLEAALEKAMADLRPIIFPLQDRVTALEETVSKLQPPAPADPAPAPTEKPNEESTAAAASGEPAAGS